MAEPVCAICQGSGWKIIERDGLSAAERCQCAIERRQQALVRRARIPQNYEQDRFDNFNIRGSKELGSLLLMLTKYCNDFPALDPPGLLFIGDPGCGKTHLATAVLQRLVENGHECLFMDYQNLLERIRAGYDPLSGESAREVYEEALEVPVLLLDDLGAHRVTDWVEDTVTSIITYRCNERKPVIATTNLADPDMGGKLVERQSAASGGGYDIKRTLAEKIGMRARSRLFEMCKIIKMPAVGDYRVANRR